MNRTKTLIIFGAITLSIFLVFNTAITTNSSFKVYAIAPETKEGYDEIEQEERSYNDYDYSSSSSMMNDYYAQGPPSSMMITEKGEYNPDRYGGYYNHYEGDFYLDQYEDGNPYDGINGPYNGNDDDNPYNDGNGSPYIIG